MSLTLEETVQEIQGRQKIVQDHIDYLVDLGLPRSTIASRAGLSRSTLYRITNHGVDFLHKDTVDSILSVKAPAGMEEYRKNFGLVRARYGANGKVDQAFLNSIYNKVDATGAMRLLQDLELRGFHEDYLSPKMDLYPHAIDNIRRGKFETIPVRVNESVRMTYPLVKIKEVPTHLQAMACLNGRGEGYRRLQQYKDFNDRDTEILR